MSESKEAIFNRMMTEPLTDELVDAYLAFPVEEVDESSVNRVLALFKKKLFKSILDEELNGIFLDLYPYSIANGSVDAQEQRSFAEDVANHLGEAKTRILSRLCAESAATNPAEEV